MKVPLSGTVEFLRSSSFKDMVKCKKWDYEVCAEFNPEKRNNNVYLELYTEK